MKTLGTIIILIAGINCFAQDMTGNPPEIEKYYFVELIPNPDSAKIPQAKLDSLQKAHMINLATMFRDGQLMLAGPFEEGGGILILDMPSKEAAQELINRDPHVKAGRLLTEIRAWYTAKGIFPIQQTKD